MAPSALRRQLLSEMRKTVLAMMSPDWDIALEGLAKAEVNKAARTLLATQRARLRLGNAELSEIRDQLAAKEKDLVSGMKALQRSRKKLANVKTLLAAASEVVRIVGRIVGLAV
jgi:hypothetical protein